MSANKGESDRCINIARKAINAGNTKKAIKFLEKSIQLCGNETAKQMLQELTTQPQPKSQARKSKPSPNPNYSQQTQPNKRKRSSTQSQSQKQQSQNFEKSNDYQNPPNKENSNNPPKSQNSNSDEKNDEKIDWSNYFSMNNGENSANSSMSDSNYDNSSQPQRPQRAGRSSSSFTSAASASSSRMDASEEVEMVRRILRAKDYYDILGVSKNADENEMKKKYRKLALKLHPDRNKAPGAEEAFKKLSAAYDCLRNADKRSMYDQYGTDSPQSMRGHGFGGSQFQQMTPDDIIRMFFGGDFRGFPNGASHTFHFGGPGRRHHHTRRRTTDEDESSGETRGGSLFMFMQLLPLLFVVFSMFLPTLLSSGGGSNSSYLGNNSGNGASSWEGQYFSLDLTNRFSREESTSLGTKYYVRKDNSNSRYKNPWGGYNSWNPMRNKNALEEQVESSYLNKLINDCDTETKLFKTNVNSIKNNKNTITNQYRIKKIKSLQKSNNYNNNKYGHNANFKSNYQIGNGNGKMCSKLDEYLENLS